MGIFFVGSLEGRYKKRNAIRRQNAKNRLDRKSVLAMSKRQADNEKVIGQSNEQIAHARFLFNERFWKKEVDQAE